MADTITPDPTATAPATQNTKGISDITYLYEFIFTDQFDDSIFSQYSNASDPLKVQIQNTTNSLKNIIRIKPGIRSISSFSNYLDNTYKVTLINTSWVPPSDGDGSSVV
uniref:Uncharacterized protein n=1 Tax=viral metagenome TaxID=1070528 RepID=A0A6C0KUP5_9ZZZZ